MFSCYFVLNTNKRKMERTKDPFKNKEKCWHEENSFRGNLGIMNKQGGSVQDNIGTEIDIDTENGPLDTKQVSGPPLQSLPQFPV